MSTAPFVPVFQHKSSSTRRPQSFHGLEAWYGRHKLIYGYLHATSIFMSLSLQENQQHQESRDATPAERSAQMSSQEKVPAIPECIASTLAAMTAQLNILTQVFLRSITCAPVLLSFFALWTIGFSRRHLVVIL